MDCSKNEGAVAALPDDPLVEILSHVPAKSVCRFKCVSKAWRDLIAHPDHRKKLRQAMQGLFLTAWEGEHYSFSFIDLIPRSVPLDIDSAFSFLTQRPGFQKLSLIDSCNGLVLFQNQQEEPLHSDAPRYIVCNPTTKRWEGVPSCGSLDLLTCSFLAFDGSISSHFHLVQFKMLEMNDMLMSLRSYSSETRTWSHNQIDSQEKQGPLSEWHHRASLTYTWDPQCAFVNGFLYFVVRDRELNEPKIVVLDVQGKTTRMITVPGVDDKWHRFRFCYLGQSQGCLHCITQDKLLGVPENNNKLFMSIWVLQNYDKQEWVLKKTVSCQETFVEWTTMHWDFEVVGIHQDCNVVFILQLNGKLIAYDMDHEEVSVISTFKDQKEPCGFHRYVPCFSESPALSN